eukprot:5819883-Pyramimonas_sp.AAC.1
MRTAPHPTSHIGTAQIRRTRKREQPQMRATEPMGGYRMLPTQAPCRPNTSNALRAQITN